MTKIEQKISEIIKKIDENLSKENLSDKEVKKLLNEIDDELVEVKDNAEKNQKEIVDEEIEKLRSDIDKGRDNKWKWNRVKDFLDEDVRDGLKNLKSKVVKVEESMALTTFTGGSKSGSAEEELSQWRKFFRGQSPELVFKHVEGLENYFLQTNSALEKSKNKSDIAELSGEVTKSAETYLRLAREAGDASGLGIFVTPIASLVAVGGSVTHGLTAAGATVFESTIDSASELANRWMDGADKNFGVVMNNATEVATSFFDIFKSNDKTLEEKLKASEDFIKILQQQLEDLQQQSQSMKKEGYELLKNQQKDFKQRLENRDVKLEEQKKDFEQRLNNRDERIEKKDKRIEDLEKEVKELNKKLVDHLESHVQVDPKS